MSTSNSAHDEFDEFDDEVSIAMLDEIDRVETAFFGSGLTSHTQHDDGPDNLVNSHTAALPLIPPEPTKRLPGRPRGSKKVLQRPQSHIATATVKRGRGRPRGTGPKQLAALGRSDIAETSTPQAKRPVGRPRKQTRAAHSSAHSIRGLFVPGKMAPLGVGSSRREDAVSMSSPDPNAGQTIAAKPGPAIRLHPTAAGPAPAPSSPTYTEETRVIPEEDSARSIILPDDDDEADGEVGLLGDGIGDDEDDDIDGGENSEDEQDPEEEGSGEAQRRSRARRPLPTWLKEVFDRRVKESGTRGKDGEPPLYRDHQTFWFPRQSNFFSLRDSAAPSPSALYNYDMFLWDPESLLPEGLPCPKCSTRLYRHCHIPRPRRCIDLTRTIWIIGYRYRCPSCLNPASKKTTVTFRSWDSRILARLPHNLAVEFPARLTHHSGISNHALMFMRSCFQHGMGSKQFSNALRVQHLQLHDEIHLQYLHHLASRKTLSEWQGRIYRPFLPFDDLTKDGFHGFIPNAQWLRDVYDHFIESHRDEFNQHSAMLTGNVCAIDHSFKITKHIAKVNGVQVFTALLTVTNEKGEIRICNLVATKAHSQFELALNRMRESLDLYGHDQPVLFYTDNVADKEFLERCFPSLREGVLAVEKYSHLPSFTIPSDVEISVLRTSTEIDDTMRSILQLLPDDDDETGVVVIALDSEWNVETSERGYVTGRGQTAVLQIALGKKIYILQIGLILAGKQLPQALKQVLSNPRILKVGRCVTADLKYLQQACGSTTPFLGGVDLGKFAKDRLIVKTAKLGLSDLCASVLHQCLGKNVPERLSASWGDENLSDSHIHYAASDVYASICIYNELSVIPLPAPLSPDAPPRTAVLLFNDDHSRVIARGITSDAVSCFADINVTPTRCLIEVHEVCIPGAIITTHKKKSLRELGPAPFSLVCLRSHLRTTTTTLLPPLPAALPAIEPAPIVDMDIQVNPIAISDAPSMNDEQNFLPAIGALMLDTLGGSAERQPLEHFSMDPGSQELGERILPRDQSNFQWFKLIRTRVPKDPFHLFNMFYISVAHGLRVDFSSALRDALFIPDEADKQRIIVWGAAQNPPQTWDYMLRTKAKWLWRHCKRTIPPPEQLYPLVEGVFRTYGPLKDAKTGLPLFNAAAWGVSKNILDLVRKGHVSDPPGIALYYQIGVDAKAGGLPIYRCIRGTNMTEGGVHTHLRSRLPTSGVSIRHVQSCLLDFILRHNLLVGTLNSTGRSFTGHYSIWLTNKIQEMTIYIQDIVPDTRLLTGWVNGNLYTQSNEVSGVLPIPKDVRIKSGMAEYQTVIHSNQPHHFLASMQGTRKPVLPIHNTEERALFRELMSNNMKFSMKSGVDWEEAVKVWNAHADEQRDISYKLTEHLKVYYGGDWEAQVNIKQTMSITASERLPLKRSLRDPTRSTLARPAAETSLKLHSVQQGFVGLPPGGTDISSQPGPSWQPPSRVSPTSHIISTQASLPYPQRSPSTYDPTHTISLKRAADASTEVRPTKKARQKRSCRKCALGPECNGRKEVTLCNNPCKDCQEHDCRGRNPKRPSQPCHRGWEELLIPYDYRTVRVMLNHKSITQMAHLSISAVARPRCVSACPLPHSPADLVLGRPLPAYSPLTSPPPSPPDSRDSRSYNRAEHQYSLPTNLLALIPLAPVRLLGHRQGHPHHSRSCRQKSGARLGQGREVGGGSSGVGSAARLGSAWHWPNTGQVRCW
ncbi:hypothetical protein FPV67DRAFT_1525179 [Lyophyllum atratum]|nr:hypothetical protein FPV67DRAFT_1525179 [Lyophyllum atratum]